MAETCHERFSFDHAPPFHVFAATCEVGIGVLECVGHDFFKMEILHALSVSQIPKTRLLFLEFDLACKIATYRFIKQCPRPDVPCICILMKSAYRTKDGGGNTHAF